MISQHMDTQGFMTTLKIATPLPRPIIFPKSCFDLNLGENIMKKIVIPAISVTLLLGLLVCFTSCGKQAGHGSTASSEQVVQEVERERTEQEQRAVAQTERARTERERERKSAELLEISARVAREREAAIRAEREANPVQFTAEDRQEIEQFFESQTAWRDTTFPELNKSRSSDRE